MSLAQKFSKLSVRARGWYVLGIIFIFAVTVGLAAGGNVYNGWSKQLAAKTNGIVVLPVVKDLPFSLGLDLQGGAHLVYSADVTTIAAADRTAA